MEENTLSVELLETIIEGFATEGKIFSKEAQFQFDLAWEIHNKGYDIVLEYLCETKDGKQYIDLVVFSKGKENKCWPIELKYKTLDKKITYKVGETTSITYNQGAPDNGSYDYIKDISRIENIEKNLNYNGEEYCVECGYAIIMTNDWHYYEELPEKRKNDKYKYWYWKNFSLAQNELKGDIKWIDPLSDKEQDKGTHTTKDREDSINLKNTYSLKNKWKKYGIGEYTYEPNLKKDPDLKYLITEIPTSKKQI
jgi:hypothetical protein